MNLVLDARQLSKAFNGETVLDRIDFQCFQGEVVSLIGRSGSGKSTLLRCLNRLERPDSGMVFIEGEPLGYEQRGHVYVESREKLLQLQRRKIGMVFQNFNLFGNMTAIQNVSFALAHVHRKSRAEARALASEALAEVGLSSRENHYPSQLSGGQQQRVAIARALASRPKAMLFDEPTSALDPELIGEVLASMRKIAESGMTMIVVTHEMSFARDVATRTIVLDGGQIVEEGPPEEVLKNPKHPRTAAFIQKLSK